MTDNSVRAGSTLENPSWQASLRHAFRDGAELLSFLRIDRREAPELDDRPTFPVFVPREFAARMKTGDPRDPLLRQVLAVADENKPALGFSSDPLGESAQGEIPGLLRKYGSRALLITTGACAVNCRYCFRRSFPYETAPKGLEAWTPALERLRSAPEIDEVILSGGDPLMLTDERLAELVSALESIPHLTRLRVHSRTPVVVPARITTALLELIKQSRFTTIVVLHINHPAEIDESLELAIRRMTESGIPLLNQAVLLKGINDDKETLVALCKRLVNLKVFPYYLHQLDKVAGAAHFETKVGKGLWLMDELRKELPGYAVPKFVREIPGELSKRSLA